MTERLTFGGGASPDAPPVDPQRTADHEHTANGEVEGSLISQLRQAATKQQEIHIKDLVIGGEFRKQLWIRYQPLGDDAMDRWINRRQMARERMEADPKATMPVTQLNMDLMAQACSAVVGADSNGENKVILEDGIGKMRLEHRLAVYLGMPVPGEIELNARDVIMLLFGGNAIAVMNHGDELLAWLNDPTEQPSAGKS